MTHAGSLQLPAIEIVRANRCSPTEPPFCHVRQCMWLNLMQLYIHVHIRTFKKIACTSNEKVRKKTDPRGSPRGNLSIPQKRTETGGPHNAGGSV